MSQEALSVTGYLTQVRRLLEPTFRNGLVRGELSNLTRQSSGNLYFVLKDQRSQLRCRMGREQARRVSLPLREGMAVVLSGDLRIYPDRGELRMEVRTLEPDGLGQLFVELELLKQRLAAEGLFHPSRKRPVPRFPRRVGLVTSLQGAVLRDLYTTIRRRNSAVELILSPSLVQGLDAPKQLRDALRRFRHCPVDCVILARGGGSVEDLMPFNHEGLLRYLAGYPIPVISAVGHETDTTLCDLVCDVRAATPTAAAELVSPPLADMQAELARLRQRANGALLKGLEAQRERLQRLASSPALRFPLRALEQRRGLLQSLEGRLRTALQNRSRQEGPRLENLRVRLQAGSEKQISQQRQLLERLQDRMQALSPLGVLDRGYGLCLDASGKPVTSVQGRRVGEGLEMRLSDGSLGCILESIRGRDPETDL